MYEYSYVYKPKKKIYMERISEQLASIKDREGEKMCTGFVVMGDLGRK